MAELISKIPKPNISYPNQEFERSEEEVLTPGKESYDVEHQSQTKSERDNSSSNSIEDDSEVGAGEKVALISTTSPTAGHNISVDQLDQLQNLAEEQQKASQILMDKVKNVLKDVRGPHEKRIKWFTGINLTVILAVIMAVLVLGAAVIIKSLYPSPVETPISTYVGYIASFGKRVFRIFK